MIKKGLQQNKYSYIGKIQGIKLSCVSFKENIRRSVDRQHVNMQSRLNKTRSVDQWVCVMSCGDKISWSVSQRDVVWGQDQLISESAWCRLGTRSVDQWVCVKSSRNKISWSVSRRDVVWGQDQLISESAWCRVGTRSVDQWVGVMSCGDVHLHLILWERVVDDRVLQHLVHVIFLTIVPELK